MITRHFNLLKIIDKKSSLLLFGPRGSGKTNLIEEATAKISSYKIISYDLLKGEVFRSLIVDPSMFRRNIEFEFSSSNKPLLVIIDEVQKIPELLDEVHYLIEHFKGRVQFILSGSSARKIKRAGANLLAGRAWNKHLFPFSTLECDLNVQRSLEIGTLPKAYLSEDLEAAHEYLKSYVTTYLREEIIQEAVVRKIDSFSRFLDLAGQINTEPVNFTKLSRQIQVSTKTVQSYFQILVDTLIATPLYGWDTSIKRQLLQAPKYYLFDPGIVNAINGELKSELKESSYRFGKLFETFVVNEILRYNDYLGADFKPFFWRTSQGNEVDMILAKPSNQPQFAIEIKSSRHPLPADADALLMFQEDYPAVECLCLCQVAKSYELNGIKFMPFLEGLKYIFS